MLRSLKNAYQVSRPGFYYQYLKWVYSTLTGNDTRKYTTHECDYTCCTLTHSFICTSAGVPKRLAGIEGMARLNNSLSL